jgi:quinol monooxygenase YgiN
LADLVKLPDTEVLQKKTRSLSMVKFALYVRLEAKPGKEEEIEQFLQGGLSLVEEEPATTAWFAIRIRPSTFAIFDAFPDEAGREAHLKGRVAAALMQRAADLLAEPPSIQKIDVLAAKLPA